jgi:hypothetical protein
VNSNEEDIEKLYDLNTSRFEEEFKNLPTDKKNILLGQLPPEL